MKIFMNNLESRSKPLLGSLGKIGNSVIAANTAVLQFAYFPKTGFERLSRKIKHSLYQQSIRSLIKSRWQFSAQRTGKPG
jgi:hypothetical protein